MTDQPENVTVRRERIRQILDKKGRDVFSLPPEATVYEAITMMAEKSVGALLVVSRGELVGIISERDYARKVILKSRSSRETLVKEVMSSPVIGVTSDATVDECMNVITRHRIRHLPVMENDKLAGVISIGDLVNAIISAQAETIGHLKDYIQGMS